MYEHANVEANKISVEIIAAPLDPHFLVKLSVKNIAKDPIKSDKGETTTAILVVIFDFENNL
jgi:hypothetical protein